MNLQEFINTYLGKRVADIGKDRGNEEYYPITLKNGKTEWCGYHQCGSLVKIYISQVFGLTPKSFGGDGGVANGWNNNAVFPFSEYTHIPFGEIPQAGDIVIFARSSSNWHYGHIGIIVHADENGYQILEQNAGKGRGFGKDGDEISIRNKHYNESTKILGYVRHKSINNTSSHNNSPLSGEIWNEERPYDIATEEEVDTMLIRAFGETADFYAIFRRVWSGLEYDPNATRAILFVRTGRRHNNNHEFIFDRLTAAQYILYIKSVWNNGERKIATEKDLRELMEKYFPGQNILDVCRRYFPELQEDGNLLITFRKAWYKYNGIKDFKHTRDETLAMVLKIKRDLDGHI